MKSLLLFLSKWRNLLLLFSLFLLANFLLGQFMPKEHALDLKFAYSAEEAYDAISALDLEEQRRYRIGLLALDMPYLIIYGLFFSGILIKLWAKKEFILLPLSIMVADFFENILVLRILYLLPERLDSLAVSASVFTTCKWILVALMALVIIFGMVWSLISRWSSKSSNPKAIH